MRISTQDVSGINKRQYLLMQRRMAWDTLVKGSGNNLCVCEDTFASTRANSIEECKITIEIHNANVIAVPVWKALDFGIAPYRATEDSIIYGGAKVSYKELPIFDLSDCEDIRAVDNYVYFENGRYYKSTNDSGESYVLSCRGNLSQPLSQFLKEGWSEDASEAGMFWSLLSQGKLVSYYYSDEEIVSYLEKAGVKPGWFTVNVAGKSVEYYYSPDRTDCKSSIMLLSKGEYDNKYALLTNEGGKYRSFKEVPIGSVFKIDGKEYVMDENYSIDIPYGIDLTKIEYPKNTFALELEASRNSQNS